MAKGYSGKEFGCIIGIQDVSDQAIGTAVAADADFVANTRVQMRLDTINDFNFDGGYQRTELNRSGSRSIRSEDIINHYGSGIWTWDFEYIVDNYMGIQNLLNLIYPETASTAASTSGVVIPAAPTTTDMSHGSTALDCVAGIVIQNPEADEDRLMHSAVLQNLTLSMDAGTNGGNIMASGQFMSGYKPTVGANTFSADTSASDITGADNIFDCTTHTIGGSAVTVRSFSLTINNPANRVGYQGSSGETDGYIRGGLIGVTGEIVVKADSTTMDLLPAWQANTLQAIVMQAGTATQLSFSLPSCHMSGHALDMAEEGSFITIPFTCTSGADAATAVSTIKFTSAT